MNAVTDLDLLLIGKTGNGKSATGNSILGFKAFESSSSTGSVTSSIEFDFAEVQGLSVKVVDGPGVYDTHGSCAQSIALFTREMEYAIFANTRGYHAFLIILKYGSRFTEEDSKTINILKAVFGESFAKEYCILVMTGGDSYNEPFPFIDWCKKQKGKFQDLLSECCHRIVLFDNRLQDNKIQENQIKQLFTLVDGLNGKNGKRYTDANFREAMRSQALLILNTQKDIIKEETFKETRYIMTALHNIQNSVEDKGDALETLLCRTEALLKNLEGVDKNTGHLFDLIKIVYELENNVSVEIKVNYSIKAEREKYKEKQVLIHSKHKQDTKDTDVKYIKLKADCPNDERKKELLNQEKNKKLSALLKEYLKQCLDNKIVLLEKKKAERKKTSNRNKNHLIKLKKLEKKYKELKSLNTHNIFSLLIEKIQWSFGALISAILGYLL